MQEGKWGIMAFDKNTMPLSLLLPSRANYFLAISLVFYLMCFRYQFLPFHLRHGPVTVSYRRSEFGSVAVLAPGLSVAMEAPPSGLQHQGGSCFLGLSSGRLTTFCLVSHLSHQNNQFLGLNSSCAPHPKSSLVSWRHANQFKLYHDLRLRRCSQPACSGI